MDTCSYQLNDVSIIITLFILIFNFKNMLFIFVCSIFIFSLINNNKNNCTVRDALVKIVFFLLNKKSIYIYLHKYELSYLVSLSR
jgi:hypothetical protein